MTDNQKRRNPSRNQTVYALWDLQETIQKIVHAAEWNEVSLDDDDEELIVLAMAHYFRSITSKKRSARHQKLRVIGLLRKILTDETKTEYVPLSAVKAKMINVLLEDGNYYSAEHDDDEDYDPLGDMMDMSEDELQEAGDKIAEQLFPKVSPETRKEYIRDRKEEDEIVASAPPPPAGLKINRRPVWMIEKEEDEDV